MQFDSSTIGKIFEQAILVANADQRKILIDNACGHDAEMIAAVERAF